MERANGWRGVRIYTVGHSTRSLQELVVLLGAFEVSVLADIRTIPRSRRNPQFNLDALPSALKAQGLVYAHLPELGGLRRPRKDSPNAGWRNTSFRGYADYMQTEAFEHGLAALRALTVAGPVALMCAEAVPWRCHRSLVADALVARGASVEHIIGAKRSNPHRTTAFAKVIGTRVTYPPGPGEVGTLATPAPFHLEATVRVLQRRPTNLVDVWDQSRYLRVLETAEGHALAEVVNHGTIDHPDVRFKVLHGKAPSATRNVMARILRQVLGLDVDPSALERAVDAERRLASAAAALRGMRPPRFASLFEAFANVVPFQQVSLDAGVITVGRLVERFGTSVAHGGRRFHAFPSVEVVAGARVDSLKRCGLSLRKAETLRHVARAIRAGELSEEKLAGLGSDEALRFLTDLPGIGPWSAALVLLRGMGRLEVFPPGDVGVIRGLSTLLRIRSAASLARAVERFGDRRGYLYFYSLGSALLARDLIHVAPPRLGATGEQLG